MTPIARRQLLIAAGGFGTAGLAIAAEPRRDYQPIAASAIDSLIPAVVGLRQARDDQTLVPPEIEGASAGRTVSRSYVAAGLPTIMLVVSYHGARSPELKVHRPETCYAVAGFTLSGVHPMQLDLDPSHGVAAVRFEAKRGPRQESVLYWTRVARRFPQTLSEQRWAFLAEAMRGVRADGLLARLSTVEAPESSAPKLLARFAQELWAATSESARPLLVG